MPDTHKKCLKLVTIFQDKSTCTMDMKKPLRDWELSLLSDRISIRNFEQIALEYLGMTQVRELWLKPVIVQSLPKLRAFI